MRLRIVSALVLTSCAGYCAAVLPVPVRAERTSDLKQLLSRISAAAGGEEAQRRVTSRVSRGFIVTAAGRAPITVYQKGPEQFLVMIDSPAGGMSRNGFDGKVAWSENQKGVVTREGPEVGFFRREQTLHREIRLAELFKTLSVDSENNDGGASISIRAVSDDGLTERFVFDAKSYLLSRHEVEVGGTLVRAEFDDYRAIDGVPVAHRIRRSRPDFSWVTEFSDVRHNTAVEDSLFVKPQVR